VSKIKKQFQAKKHRYLMKEEYVKGIRESIEKEGI